MSEVEKFCFTCKSVTIQKVKDNSLKSKFTCTICKCVTIESIFSGVPTKTLKMVYDNTVLVYTDGSCNNKTNDKGGYGIIMKFGDKEKEFFGGSYSNTTSSRMEIMAVIVALENIRENYRVRIHSDSRYVVDSINKKWVFSWEKTNFIGKANSDLWVRFIELYRKFPTGFISILWIRGHNGHTENERCDKLAKKGGSLKEIIIDKT